MNFYQRGIWRIVLVCLIFLSNVAYISAFALTPIQVTEQRFHPVSAQHVMVASQEQLATQAGLAILKQGGNAVDAAVAVGFALAVTLPRAGNLAGGGFMLIYWQPKQQVYALNYREKAPLHATSNMFLDALGNVDQSKWHSSYAAVGVPGTVAGLVAAQKRFGVLSLAQDLEPAIKLAEQGIPVSFSLAHAIQEAHASLMHWPASQREFFKSNGQPYQPGDYWRRPELANTLRLIAQKGQAGFYQGKVAKAIVEDMQRHQGLITLNDLQQYHASWVTPLHSVFRDHDIYVMPPPSSGGVALIQLLNILDIYPLQALGLNSAASIHLLTEAMNLAYRDRNHYLGDPRFVKIPLKKLLSKEHAQTLRQSLNETQHVPAKELSPIPQSFSEGPNTTHFSVIDQQGNMVANTYTLNFSFGNGAVVPGTGILLNNQMADFTAKPGVANPYGLVEGEANQIEPGKQPLSSMTPTIILDKAHKPYIATGTPGGSRIITTMLQFILNVLEHHLNIASATAVPRIHSQLWPDQLSIEQGISIDTQKILGAMGHQIVEINAMGSIQTVMQTPDGHKLGYADPRRAGALAAGY
ncbi:MAG: gamma-glutamyltransferase [Gammaproteobacteria bacterium]